MPIHIFVLVPSSPSNFLFTFPSIVYLSCSWLLNFTLHAAFFTSIHIEQFILFYFIFWRREGGDFSYTDVDTFNLLLLYMHDRGL